AGAELQVLRSVVGMGHLLRDAHRQGQVAPQLPYDNRHADVAGMQLHVATGAMGPTAHGTVYEGSGQVICYCLVNTLVCTLLKGLEYDGDLWTHQRYWPANLFNSNPPF
uniref:Uncharacterized protein n=1 Tax=Oncorhynchus kisutch TaxID=8019 RepID=A0A8C7LG51_ONCKI